MAFCLFPTGFGLLKAVALCSSARGNDGHMALCIKRKHCTVTNSLKYPPVIKSDWLALNVIDKPPITFQVVLKVHSTCEINAMFLVSIILFCVCLIKKELLLYVVSGASAMSLIWRLLS